jgi:hypothetical protein
MTDTFEPRAGKPEKLVRAEDKLLFESPGGCGTTFYQAEVSRLSDCNQGFDDKTYRV